MIIATVKINSGHPIFATCRSGDSAFQSSLLPGFSATLAHFHYFQKQRHDNLFVVNFIFPTNRTWQKIEVSIL